MQAPSPCYRRAPIYAFDVFPVSPRPRHQKPLVQPVPAQILMPDTFTVKLNRFHLRLLEEQRHYIHGLQHEVLSCRQLLWSQATHLHSQAAQLDSQAAQIAAMQQQLIDIREGSTGPTVMQRLAALELHQQHAEAHSVLAASEQPSVGCQGNLSARVADLEQHLGLFSEALDHMHAMSDLAVQIRTVADESIAIVRQDADHFHRVLEEAGSCKQLQNITAAIDAEHAETSASDTASNTVSNSLSDTVSYPASDPLCDTASCGDNDIASDTGSDTGSVSTPKWAAAFCEKMTNRLMASMNEFNLLATAADPMLVDVNQGGVKVWEKENSF